MSCGTVTKICNKGNIYKIEDLMNITEICLTYYSSQCLKYSNKILCIRYL